jgi:hypothetical protein
MQIICKEDQIYIVGSTGMVEDPRYGIAPGSMVYQKKTDCYFQCLGYADNMLGGNRDSSYYSNAYNNSYGNASNGETVSAADVFLHPISLCKRISTIHSPAIWQILQTELTVYL